MQMLRRNPRSSLAAALQQREELQLPAEAVRDHREATILLRVEVSALAALLIDNGVFTTDDWASQLLEECRLLEEGYQKSWPGAASSDDGMVYDHRATEWMQGWKP